VASKGQRGGREVSPLLNNIRKGQGSGLVRRQPRGREAAVALMRAGSLEHRGLYGRKGPGECRFVCDAADRSSPRYGAVTAGAVPDTQRRAISGWPLRKRCATPRWEPLANPTLGIGQVARRRLKCRRSVSPVQHNSAKVGGGCRLCITRLKGQTADAVVY